MSYHKCKVCKKRISEQEYKALWEEEICEDCWGKREENRTKRRREMGLE